MVDRKRGEVVEGKKNEKVERVEIWKLKRKDGGEWKIEDIKGKE